MSAVAAARAVAERECIMGELDVVGFVKCRDDGVEVEFEEREESVVGYVARRDDQELTRRPSQKVRLAEVPILRNEDTAVVVRAQGDLAVA